MPRTMHATFVLFKPNNTYLQMHTMVSLMTFHPWAHIQYFRIWVKKSDTFLSFIFSVPDVKPSPATSGNYEFQSTITPIEASGQPIRGLNKAGPQATCPQNLMRALKMLIPRAQMALEMSAHFNTWFRKIKSCPEKNWGPSFYRTRGSNDP